MDKADQEQIEYVMQQQAERQRRLADAKGIVEKAAQQRVDAVVAGIDTLLKEHNCELLGIPQLTPDGRIGAVVRIVAK